MKFLILITFRRIISYDAIVFIYVGIAFWLLSPPIDENTLVGYKIFTQVISPHNHLRLQQTLPLLLTI